MLKTPGNKYYFFSFQRENCSKVGISLHCLLSLCKECQLWRSRRAECTPLVTPKIVWKGGGGLWFHCAPMFWQNKTNHLDFESCGSLVEEGHVTEYCCLSSRLVELSRWSKKPPSYSVLLVGRAAGGECSSDRKEPESALSWWHVGTAPLKLHCTAKLGWFQSCSLLFCRFH